MYICSDNSGAMQIPSINIAIINFQNHPCCGRRREGGRGGMGIASHQLCFRSVSLHGPVCIPMCVPLCVFTLMCVPLCVRPHNYSFTALIFLEPDFFF